jgi:putative ABC transport system substrate-binding protein
MMISWLTAGSGLGELIALIPIGPKPNRTTKTTCRHRRVGHNCSNSLTERSLNVQVAVSVQRRAPGRYGRVTFLTTELTPKRLELLHETVPTVGSIGWVGNPTLREAQIREVETVARTLGIRLAIANASTPGEIETASASLVGQGIGALLVSTDIRGQLAGLTARRDLPAIYPLRQFAEVGGLMSYEASLSDAV